MDTTNLDYNLNRTQALADRMINLFARSDISKLFDDSRQATTGG
jgi:hypothetical protein